MKRGLRLFILSALIFLLFIVGRTSPVFAAPVRASVSTAHLTRSAVAREQRRVARHVDSRMSWRPAGQPGYGGTEKDNQSYQGDSSDGNTSKFIGHNLNNTGNPGRNHGVNMDDSSNAGNQVIHRHGIRGHRRINQIYHGSSNNNRRSLFWGYNLDNTGNPGHNYGYNQDNSSNAGNQVID